MALPEFRFNHTRPSNDSCPQIQSHVQLLTFISAEFALSLGKNMLLLQKISTLPAHYRPSISLTEQGVSFHFGSDEQKDQAMSVINPELFHLVVETNAFIVPHREFHQVLVALGLPSLGLHDAIETYYLEQETDRCSKLADESRHPHLFAHPLTETMFTINKAALGPRPQQLLTKISVCMPEIILSDEPPSPARVTFVLDRSGSMQEQNRIELLKQAVKDSIEKLAPDVLVSVYFYNDQACIIFENKAAKDISTVDYTLLLAIVASGRTSLSSVIQPLVSNMRKTGVLDDAIALANSTIIWLTDGDDQDLKTADHLANLFYSHGCPEIPKLIAVGIGQYNETLLNGVAADFRFKSNLMLHLDSPTHIDRLFQGISRCIGVMRKRAIVWVDVEGSLVYKDLGILQAGQTKSFFMELPKPHLSQEITGGLLLEDVLYRAPQSLPHDCAKQNIDLIIEYYHDIQDKIVMAEKNDPESAEKMRTLVLASIPSNTRHSGLRELRRAFLPAVRLMREEDIEPSWLKRHFGSTQAFFPKETSDQTRYSMSLERTYTQQI